MASRRVLTLLLLAGLCLCIPRSVAAAAIANSELSFSNLTITPGTGALTLDDVWLMQAFASANNSLGESDAHFNFAFSPGSTQTTAAVTWAKASAAVNALGDPPNLAVGGGATSSVNIPGCQPAAAFATGIGTLSNFFTISGTGTVAVAFGIDVAGILNVMTDGCGILAETETIFNLQVDGDPLLFHERLLSIGPSDARTLSFGIRLTNTVVLDAGVSHFLILQADSESRGVVPEPATGALLIAGLVVLVYARGRGRGLGRDEMPERATI